jgi:hypothetical protein
LAFFVSDVNGIIGFSVSTYTGDRRIVSIRLRYDRLVVDYVSPSDSSALLASIAGSVSVDGDPLADREEAVPWLRAAGLLPADAVISNSEHAALLRLRDALRDVLDARSAGMAAPDSSARLTRALADGRLVVTVSPSGKAVLASSARAPYSNLVAAIAIAVADAW